MSAAFWKSKNANDTASPLDSAMNCEVESWMVDAVANVSGRSVKKSTTAGTNAITCVARRTERFLIQFEKPT